MVMGNKGIEILFIFKFDTNNNLIQYENLTTSQFLFNEDKVEFYPGSHIKFRIWKWNFIIKYNFLRKKRWRITVLVHTLDKNDTKIGDVYTDIDNICWRWYNIPGTEEQYRDNPTTTEELKIEDLKYQIDEISPSRTEIRLKAKNKQFIHVIL